MKKRIMAFAMACALSLSMAAIPFMDVSAAEQKTYKTPKGDMTARQWYSVENNVRVPNSFKDYDGNVPDYYSYWWIYDTETYKVALTAGDNDGMFIKTATDYFFGTRSGGLNAMKLKPSGAKATVVSGDAKDSLLDNGVKPCIKEFTKNYLKMVKGKTFDGTTAEKLAGVYYGSLTDSQAGDVTFKLEDNASLNNAMSGDCYAIVLHYTGNAADEDGVTAQFSKISSAGKITAHFNSLSPFAIIVTTETSSQKLANTYSHGVGTDAANLTPAATTVAAPTVAAPVTSTATPATATAATAAAPATATAATAAAPAAATTATTAAPAAAPAAQGIQTTTAQSVTAPAATTAAPAVTTTAPAAPISQNNGPIMVVR